MWSQTAMQSSRQLVQERVSKMQALSRKVWNLKVTLWSLNIAMEHRYVVWHFMGTTSIDITHIFHVKWPVVGVINSHLPAWPSTGRALRYQPATIEIMTGSHMCTQNAFIEASFMENLASCFSAMSAMVTGPERQHPSWWPSLQSDASNR